MLYDDQTASQSAYAIVNSSAHRKPAPVLGAPGLVQHLAYWKPRHCSGPRGRSDWHKQVDFFLYRLFAVLYNDAVVQDSGSGQRGSVPAYFDCPNWDQARAKLYLFRSETDVRADQQLVPCSLDSFEMHFRAISKAERSVRYEIFTLFTRFHGIPITVRAELRHEFWTLCFLADFSRPIERGSWALQAKMFDAFEELAAFFQTRMSHDRADDTPVTEEVRSGLYQLKRNFYDDFHNLIQTEILLNCLNGSGSKQAAIGEIFADFRGLALHIVGNNSKLGPSSFRIALPPTDGRILRRRVEDVDGEAFCTSRSLRIVDGLWPAIREFFATHDPKDKRRQSEKPEFTITRFQNMRSIYVSSLGRYMSNDGNGADPVRFLVLTSSPSRWQLGRLVERLVSMGTLRLAAIFDIQALQSASDRLQEVSEVWRNRKASGALDLIKNKIETELIEIESSVPGGLTNRIERSSYYVHSFNSILTDMRLNVLEGFQSYPVFVRRRMGGTFDFIKRIGTRLESLRGQMRLSLESETAFRTMKAARKSQELLARAEWFLVAGGTYYVGHVLVELTDHEFPVSPMKIYAGVFAAWIVGIWGYRRVRAKHGRADHQT